jgi:hypothetical protein
MFLTQLFRVTILFTRNCPVIIDLGKESCPVVTISIQTEDNFRHVLYAYSFKKSM